jgi:hypothetical protein
LPAAVARSLGTQLLSIIIPCCIHAPWQQRTLTGDPHTRVCLCPGPAALSDSSQPPLLQTPIVRPPSSCMNCTCFSSSLSAAAAVVAGARPAPPPGHARAGALCTHSCGLGGASAPSNPSILPAGGGPRGQGLAGGETKAWDVSGSCILPRQGLVRAVAYAGWRAAGGAARKMYKQ